MKHVTIDVTDGIIVLGPKGTGDGTWGTPQQAGEMGRTLDAFARKGSFDVIVDLSRVRILNTDVWNTLHDARRKLEAAGCRMILCNLTGGLREHIFRLGFHFRLAEHLDEAREMLQGTAPADTGV